MLNRLYLAMITVIALGWLALPGVGAIIPAEREHVISLNGPWRFKLEQGAVEVIKKTGNWRASQPAQTPAEFEPFYRLDYRENADWHDLGVPGNWEIAGYSPATYNQPDNASGFYRKWIEIPASWAGRQVRLNFDGVQNGAEIWLNGQPVPVSEPSWGRTNYHEGGWTAWQADLTPQARFGQKNLLAIRVTKNTRSSDLDTGDYFFLGGIHRPVTLFSVPATHIEDLTVRTRLLAGGKAEVKVLVALTGQGSPTVRMSLPGTGPEATQVARQGLVEFTRIVSNPRLWSAEHPNLYPLTIELQGADGRTAEKIARRIGIREVTIKNGILLVNGTPVKLTGICRHDVYPSLGTAINETVWRKDLALMKAANINAVRTSHYPYGSGFYDLCDEMGFYVMDELPYCWCNTKDPQITPAFLQRARETLARDKNHPSVLMWAIGNENGSGPSLQAVADLVKQLDPTRPRAVSCKNADEYGVEMDDKHYAVPSRIAEAANDKERLAKWPHIFLEQPNVWDARFGADYGCWDIWYQVLKSNWDIIWKADGIPGAFLWEWQDRAVADKCPVKTCAFDPATGIHYFKTKGIVDGWRHPRPQYYHVKMIYSPIQIEPQLDPHSRPGSAVLSISNRYSFTNLSELKANWRLLSGGKAIRSGTARLSLAPRTAGKVALALPADAMAKAESLRIDFDHPGGWNVVSCQFALRKLPEPQISRALPPGLLFPQLNLVHNVTVADKTNWKKITRYRGSLINIRTEPEDARDLAGRPLSEVRSVEADIVLDKDPQAIVGHLRAGYADGKFSYQIDWTGDKTDIQELGWSFRMPHEFDHFSWKRQAVWSVYPETHIGRPTGTATPDSANVHITNITRPDAFDFNSTKYDCDWAALTNAAGRGLMVAFDPTARHHVRGGIEPDGSYTLIVNKQCSPPRDISSSSAKDLYLELRSGDSVQGSFYVGSK